MTTRVKVTVDELSSTRVKVSGGDKEYNLAPTATRVVEVPKGTSLTIEATEDVPVAAKPSTDVFDHRNPNGIVQAEIGPKLPKASGELKDVEENGRFVQRAVELDMGKATQAGGVKSTDGSTPGPQPEGDGSTVKAPAADPAASGSKATPAPASKK